MVRQNFVEGEEGAASNPGKTPTKKMPKSLTLAETLTLTRITTATTVDTDRERVNHAITDSRNPIRCIAISSSNCTLIMCPDARSRGKGVKNIPLPVNLIPRRSFKQLGSGNFILKSIHPGIKPNGSFFRWQGTRWNHGPFFMSMASGFSLLLC
jgi:hypothetical protein